MKLIKMSYKGFTFSVNPQTITIDYSKNIATKRLPFFASKVDEINYNPTKITGSGVFYGDNAREQAFQLERIFKSKGSEYLFVPDGTPVKAFFSALNISYDSKNGAVKYSFEFVEDCQGKRSALDFGYTFARNGENLYDIANRTGIDVGNIFEFNSYKDLFSVEDGDKVWLC